MIQTISRPQAGEYAPYASTYVDQIPVDPLPLEQFQVNYDALEVFFRSLPEEQLAYRYAPGKWNMKELLVHMMDTERIFAYRALRFARKDEQPLAGFDQDDYMPASNASERTLDEIFEEYSAIRRSSIALFRHLQPEQLLYKGEASGHAVSVRALAYMILGHEQHHLSVIKERYL
ncbi:DinB family protein [Chitinophaga pendula]|uniref:DinB family protein n=1 Tax=Chitinophaga TaxID=79328 RepID=UPI000BAFADD2|nr:MULTISPECIES: DinB family protein [Chitinophaga]ASZ11009.1 DNA damage-inducible protein DinB [Chitinophaga sp. MD30]UCJ06001.1 DinB family protein [Chitinophaga pendula]